MQAVFVGLSVIMAQRTTWNREHRPYLQRKEKIILVHYWVIKCSQILNLIYKKWTIYARAVSIWHLVVVLGNLIGSHMLKQVMYICESLTMDICGRSLCIHTGCCARHQTHVCNAKLSWKSLASFHELALRTTVTMQPWRLLAASLMMRVLSLGNL